MKRWGPMLIMSLILICATVPAYTAAPAKTPDGGTLRQALDGEVSSLDPAYCQSYQGRAMISALYDSLMAYQSGNGALTFGLGRTVQLSSDGRVFRIGLRKGVRFHNGQELTAADVKFSLDRIADPKAGSPVRILLNDVEGFDSAAAGLSGVKVIDAATIQITLAKPSMYFLSVLAEPALGIVPKDYVEKAGNEFGARPCGTGPFKLGEFSTSSVVLVKNTAYWRDGVPKLSALSWTAFDSFKAAYDAFVAGKLDFIHLNYEWFETLKARNKWNSSIQSWPLPTTFYLGFNQKRPPFDQIEVRKAISLVFNPVAYLGMHGGDGQVANGILPPGIGGHDPDRKRPARDLKTAQQLLASAGYPGGRGFPVINLYGGSMSGLQKRLLEQVKSDLESLGLRAEIRQVSPERYEEVVRRDADVFTYGWNADYPDPHNFLYYLFSSDCIGRTNLTGYRNPQVDGWLEKARQERDPKARLQQYRKIEDFVLQGFPIVPIFHPVFIRAHQPNIIGCPIHPVVPFFYDTLGFDKH